VSVAQREKIMRVRRSEEEGAHDHDYKMQEVCVRVCVLCVCACVRVCVCMCVDAVGGTFISSHMYKYIYMQGSSDIS
jgi:hypothetical protein